MATVTVQFKVAMDNEQKKAGNTRDVKFECSFDGVNMDDVKRLAIQQQIVRWQAQIRNNWDKFISDGLPRVVTFGNPLYESARGAAPMTPERAEEFLMNADRLTQVRAAINLMEKAGMDVPDQLLEEEYNLSHPTTTTEETE